jgi:hypothetical protein
MWAQMVSGVAQGGGAALGGFLSKP